MNALPFGLPQRILDGSPDAVLVSDRAGKILYWNAASERTFGFTGVEVLGSSMDVIIPERLRGGYWGGWNEVMGTGVTRYGAERLLAVPALHKDGRQLSVEFSIQLVTPHVPGPVLERAAALGVRGVTVETGPDEFVTTFTRKA